MMLFVLLVYGTISSMYRLQQFMYHHVARVLDTALFFALHVGNASLGVADATMVYVIKSPPPPPLWPEASKGFT